MSLRRIAVSGLLTTGLGVAALTNPPNAVAQGGECWYWCMDQCWSPQKFAELCAFVSCTGPYVCIQGSSLCDDRDRQVCGGNIE